MQKGCPSPQFQGQVRPRWRQPPIPTSISTWDGKCPSLLWPLSTHGTAYMKMSSTQRNRDTRQKGGIVRAPGYSQTWWPTPSRLWETISLSLVIPVWIKISVICNSKEKHNQTQLSFNSVLQCQVWDSVTTDLSQVTYHLAAKWEFWKPRHMPPWPSSSFPCWPGQDVQPSHSPSLPWGFAS